MTTTQGSLVVAVAVTNASNDYRQLLPLVRQVEAQFGVLPPRYLADAASLIKRR